MSRIEINSFSGIRPVLSADKLAGNEAQTAANCNFRSGSLELLASADIPSKTVNQFSFVDGFGTWTLAGTTFKLGGAAINQTAPNAPTVSATTAFTQASITGTTFSVSATAPSGTPTTPVSATPTIQQTGFLLNGTRLTVTYTAQPVFVGITTTAIANAFSAFTRSASLTIAGQAFTTVGQEVDLTGGVGRIKLENLDYSTATITWKKDESGVYRAYVSEWTVTFEFSVNYVTDMALERAVVYRLTTVETNGMESPASDPTSLIAIMPNNYAVVSNLTVGKTKRLYRAAGTELDAKYYFVAELASGVSSYKDLIADGDLGEVMPETENPPAAMTQVVWLPGGFCAGFYGKDIYFSEPFKLYSWPSKYTLTTQKTIVGLAVTGNDLYVLSTPPSSPDTDANNYILTGVAPEVMTMSELAVNEGCSAIGSICKVGTTIGFASPTGYILITGGRGKNITEPFYSKSQWAALTPSGMVAKESDSQIFIYNAAAAGIIIDYLSGTVRTFSTTTPTTFTWRSKAFVSDLPIELHVAQLVGASGTHTLTLYADGAASPVFTGTITAGTDLVITRGLAAAKRWEIQIAGGSAKVQSLAIIHRERIAANGPVVITHPKVEGSWLRLLMEFEKEDYFSCAMVDASVYPVVLKIYRDGGKTVHHQRTVTDSKGFWLPKWQPAGEWEIDVIPSSGTIYTVTLAKSMAALRA
jgi:hypothetical protein